MSDSWSSDEAASPVTAPGTRPTASTSELPKQQAKMASSGLKKTRAGTSRASASTAPATRASPAPASAADSEIQASPPSAVIRADPSLQSSGGINAAGKVVSKKLGVRSVQEQSSSDWDSSDGDDDSRLAAALQKKFDKHQVHNLNKFIKKKPAMSTSPQELQDARDAFPAVAAGAESAAARPPRTMTDTDAVNTSASVAANLLRAPDAEMQLGRGISSLNSADTKAIGSSSESDWDEAIIGSASAAAAASPPTDSAESPASATANVSAAALHPPLPTQPSQFTRRVLGVAGVSPRSAAPPHASPRHNPSLTPRDKAAADGRLRVDVTDSSSTSSSSSDTEVPVPAAKVPEQAAPIATREQRWAEEKSTTATQQQPFDPPPRPSRVSQASSSFPGSNPGAIISRQSSAAEEHEQQLQLHIKKSRPERALSPTAEAVAASASSPSSSEVELRGDEESPLPDKQHTRCSRLIGVPLACGLTGVCTGVALIIMGIVCFSSKGAVCGPLGSSWGTVALIAFGIFLLLSFTGLLKSAYRIYRERWDFYKLQRYQVQQQQAEQADPRPVASGRVPLDGMYFDSNQFFGNMQRTQGGGRALAPVQDDVDVLDAVSSRPVVGGDTHLTDGVEEGSTAASTSTANAAAVAAFAGVGMGRGVKVGGGMRASRGKLHGHN